MEDQTNLKNRLQEYRVDFCYSKGNFFTAASRIRKENSNQFALKRALNISVLILAIFTTSGVAFYFTRKNEDLTILSMGFFSLLSLGISIYLIIEKKEDNADDYQKRGEEYLDLYKHVKNIQAKMNDKIISNEELAKEIDKIQMMQNRISIPILFITPEDYAISKKQIDKGGSGYSEEDFKNC